MVNLERESYATREQAEDDLVLYGRTLAEYKYGPKPVAGGEYLAYHNALHTQDVISGVTKIGMQAMESGKIDLQTIGLLRIAAAFHDTVQLRGSKINEELSANKAVHMMRISRIFSGEDIERVKGFIFATIVYPANGTIEQRPLDDYATQVMCDADLALLGDNDIRYWHRSADLLKETKRNTQITPDDVEEFLNSQKALLTHHKFFTPEAQVLFPRQSKHLLQTERRLRDREQFDRFFAIYFGQNP